MARIEEIDCDAIRLQALCDACGGELVAKGSQAPDGRLWHICASCGAAEALDEAYPQTKVRSAAGAKFEEAQPGISVRR